ncbi:PWP2A protein, partial [Polyodon spathula]|nr:PWP2A protein [Polyodon spathula]
MAAVAAEAGAAAASTTSAGERVGPEPDIVQLAQAEPKIESEAAKELFSQMDPEPIPDNGDVAPECSSLVSAEAEGRPDPDPDPEAAGKPYINPSEQQENGTMVSVGGEVEAVTAPADHDHGLYGTAERENEYNGGDPEIASDPAAGTEVSSDDFQVYPEPRVISDLVADEISNPYPAPALGEAEMEAPLLEEPVAIYDHMVHTEPDEIEPIQTDCEARTEIEPLPENKPVVDGVDTDLKDENAAGQSFADSGPHCSSIATQDSNIIPILDNDKLCGADSVQNKDNDVNSTDTMEPSVLLAEVNSVASEPEELVVPRPFETETQHCEPETKPTAGEGSVVVHTETIAELIPGSEVRVMLDHIIDDALVVSFRLGEKMFSGVLMDLSRRFGPYGIPVTVYPKREYRDKPYSMQLKTEAFQAEMEKGQCEATGDAPENPAKNPLVPTNQWTSKPPPLFHEGAPYPPPLFIRDTYNQSIPQPPARKIKRPKRKLYREEPTSIMNAIKLRPRQVLCDKCKNGIVPDKKDVKKSHSDYRGEESKKRRNESVATVNKRLRSELKVEEKGRSTEGAKRHAAIVKVSSVTQTKGGGSSRVVKVTAAASQVNSSRVQLNTKKVLQSKNVDHSKAQDVLKRTKDKVQKRQRDSGGGANTTGTAASKGTIQKVHFTRRLQNSGGNAAPLPPRIRIKPQRYRNEENNSSACKAGFDKVQGCCKEVPTTTPPHCTSTRSSAGEATSSENQSPAKSPEPEPEPKPEPQPDPQAEPEANPKPEPGPEAEATDESKDLVVVSEEQEQEEKREKRGSKGNITVYMTLNQKKPDSSSSSMCSSDSADDLKSSNSECSSTETFDFPPPGSLHAPSTSSTNTTSSTTTTMTTSSSSSFSSSSSSSKEEKKLSNSLKAKVFSKNVSKCVTPDGRTICIGDIVWAKIYGFPWWPARILAITVSRKDNGLLVRQEARISWFGSPTTSFLALSQLSPFLESFQLRFNKKRKGLYRKAITEAAKAAKQLSPEVRALLTQFET